MEKEEVDVEFVDRVFFFFLVLLSLFFLFCSFCFFEFVDLVSFFFSFSFSFSFLYFFSLKFGATPLYLAVDRGHERIVQILVEKGKANVDLANQVSFFFILILFDL